MRRPSKRYRPLTITIVAVLSIAVGLLVANLTGHDVAVFAAQVVVAGLLAAWWTMPEKDTPPEE